MLRYRGNLKNNRMMMCGSEKWFRIAGLLARQRVGQLSEKELRELEEWREASWHELIDNKETFKELLENPWYLMEMHFCVIDKEFNEVPFFLNEVQNRPSEGIVGYGKASTVPT